MKIGAVLPHKEIGNDPGALKAYVQGLEYQGIDHLLIYDHVLGANPNRPGGWKGPYDKDVPFHEPLTTFAFIAAVTEKIEMMPTVLILPQRQTALVAKQAAEIAILSNNRFRLGIGTGWNTVEYEALNENFATRGKRQAEQVDLMRALWKEDSLDYRGEFHRVDNASILPRPSKPVPIWFGGAAPPLLRRCARLGDGWIPIMGPGPEAAQCITTLKTLRAEAGLSWEGFSVQAQAQYYRGTPERWASNLAKWRTVGATHLAISTQDAGKTGVDGHLARIAEYQRATAD